ncbi:MAG: SIR2 family protein [Magnetococcales bacterium]|nr:SIR2 family protein [Nitrospirota bacterium]
MFDNHEFFTENNIDKNTLFHIHGSIKHQESLVFTLDGYFTLYRNESFRNFMRKIFSGKYTILFMGYGLDEFEVLDFLFQKSVSEENKNIKCFLLKSYRKDDTITLKFDDEYYKRMGIKVLAYDKSEREYSQLYEIVKKWIEDISLKTRYLPNTHKEIDDILTENKDHVFQLIKHDPHIEDYFFKQLPTSPNPLFWFIPIKEKNYFNADHNPNLQEVPDQKGYYTVPYWNILEYLETVSSINALNPYSEVTTALVEIIDSVTTYKDVNGERIANYRTDWYMLKIILNLPIENITTKHIDFIKQALDINAGSTLIDSEIERFIQKLIQSEKKDLIFKLLNVILQYRIVQDKYTSLVDIYYLSEILSATKNGIAKVCGMKSIEIAIGKIKAIVTKDKRRFSIIGIPTIEDHPQIIFPEDYECQIVQFVRDIFEYMNAKDIEDKIKDLLQEEHPIFRRIAFHTINHHYASLSDIFWGLSTNPLDVLTTHEVYELFKAHCSAFSDKQIEQVISWIENQQYQIPDYIKNDEKEIDRFKAKHKKEWLSAMLNTNNSKVTKLYEKYNSIFPHDIKHPGFLIWTQSGFVDDYKDDKQIDFQELCTKTNTEIAEDINNFDKDDSSEWKSLDEMRLSDTLRQCVSKNPVKFSKDLEPFLYVHRNYQYNLLQGLSEACRNKRDYEWNEILTFISKLIEPDTFWKEASDDRDYRIVATIAGFIDEGTKDDSNTLVI